MKLVYSSEKRLQIAPLNTQAYNPAFEVTPAHLVTNYILDAGIYETIDINHLDGA